MFVCTERCLPRYEQNALRDLYAKSRGQCEICDQFGTCVDIPSHRLVVNLEFKNQMPISAETDRNVDHYDAVATGLANRGVTLNVSLTGRQLPDDRIDVICWECKGGAHLVGAQRQGKNAVECAGCGEHRLWPRWTPEEVAEVELYRPRILKWWMEHARRKPECRAHVEIGLKMMSLTLVDLEQLLK